jgi:hypothetical protein
MIAGIRHADEDRLLREVQPSRGVERIGIGTDDLAGIGPRELRSVREAIDGHRSSGRFQQHQGVSVDVGALRNIAELSGIVLGVEHGWDEKYDGEGFHSLMRMVRAFKSTHAAILPKGYPKVTRAILRIAAARAESSFWARNLLDRAPSFGA